VISENVTVEGNSTGSTSQSNFFFKPDWVRKVVLILVFAMGLFIRFYDLTDPPLDFHETRQMGAAVTARGMYYQMQQSAPEDVRQLAIDLWRSIPVYEPQILDRLVATTYWLVGDEYLWIARIYSSVFWIFGAIGLYLLSKEMTSADAGVIATAFFLFVPYGIKASRSFQPDPLMVCFIIWAMWSLYRWSTRPTWRRAITAGFLSGLAILEKAVAVFFILGAVVGVLALSLGFKRIFKNKQLWLMALLAILPGLSYYIIISMSRISSQVGSFIFSFQSLLLQPYFYIRWVNNINYVMGFMALVAGLLGMILFEKPSARGIAVGLWAGYIVFGLCFPFHYMTHDYYHLSIIPISALCISPFAQFILKKIAKQPFIWRTITALILIFAAGFQLWDTRVELARRDYHEEIKGWERMGRELPKDGEIIALTHSYGFRLKYYGWIETIIWPNVSDIEMGQLAGGGDFDYPREFEDRTRGVDYFLVTNFAELESQSSLKEILYRIDPDPFKGDGYRLFRLSAEDTAGS
jgi:4-amino-4-deoxy-L-arabinose transferase-like glycosyltransferase